MNRVTRISKPLLISFFISELKPALQRELLIAQPGSLNEAFSLAGVYEARNEDTVSAMRGVRWQTKPTSFLPSASSISGMVPSRGSQYTGQAGGNLHVSPQNSSHTPGNSAPIRNLMIRRLTPAEQNNVGRRDYVSIAIRSGGLVIGVRTNL